MAATTPFPTGAARGARNLLADLARRWRKPGLKETAVAIRPSLRATLGRYVAASRTIELSPRALSARLLDEVLTHEAAHAVLALDGRSSARPHGPEWRALMAAAGMPGARAVRWRCRGLARKKGGPTPTREKKRGSAPTMYHHVCPVCQASRTGRRPVKAWRCAGCRAAGLTGRLEIVRGYAGSPR